MGKKSLNSLSGPQGLHLSAVGQVLVGALRHDWGKVVDGNGVRARGWTDGPKGGWKCVRKSTARPSTASAVPLLITEKVVPGSCVPGHFPAYMG